MIRADIKTLIMFAPPAPAALILSAYVEGKDAGEEDEPGIYRIVPIWIGNAEAVNLRYALEGKKPPRPLTHDLFLDALTALDARVDHIVVDGVEGKTFSAKVYLSQHDRIIELDARPSDAVSLALREGAPLFMEDFVMNTASFPYIVRNTVSEEETLASFRTFLEEISPDDFI